MDTQPGDSRQAPATEAETRLIEVSADLGDQVVTAVGRPSVDEANKAMAEQLGFGPVKPDAPSEMPARQFEF